MKFQESIIGKKQDFAAYIRKIVPELFGNRLSVEGQTVTLPTDTDLEYKVKYDTEATRGAFTIKVSWDYGSNEETEEVEIKTE